MPLDNAATDSTTLATPTTTTTTKPTVTLKCFAFKHWHICP